MKTISDNLEVQADLEAAILHAASGTPLPADIRQRIHERAEKARKETLERFGVQDIGVDIIREIRGGFHG